MADIETWVAQDPDGSVWVYEGKPYLDRLDSAVGTLLEWNSNTNSTQIDPSLVADTDLTLDTPRKVVGLVLAPLAEEEPHE